MSLRAVNELPITDCMVMTAICMSYFLISAPERPPPPSSGKVNHHSVELFWDSALDKANDQGGKGDHRVRVVVQEQDKTGGWGNVYT